MRQIALPALALALLTGGCGATSNPPDAGAVIDDVKAENAIRQSLEQGGSLTVESVDCPSDVDVETGTIFRCEVVTGSAQNATAVLKIRNEDADVDFLTIQPHD